MESLRLICAVAIGKSAAFWIRLFRLGSGSVIAGSIAKKNMP